MKACAMLFVLVSTWTAARTAAAAPSETPNETSQTATTETHAKPHYEKLVGTFDSLGVLSARYGVQLEYLATSRDALVIYPWYMSGLSHDFISWGSDWSTATQTHGGGLDFQYRRYFGSYAGGRGFFVAPGLEIQHYATSSTTTCDPNSFEYDSGGSSCPPTSAALNQSFTYVGASFDFGVQAILPFGLTLSSSIGAQYRGVVGGSLDESKVASGWSISDGAGLRPRLRMSIGWAFL
jgi:hypothetical protein